MSSQEDRRREQGAKAGEKIGQAEDRAREEAAKAEQNIKDGVETAERKTKEGAEAAERNIKQGAEKAERNIKQGAEKAEQKAQEAKDTIIAKLKEDGVVNPKGLAMAGFGGLFIAAVPLTSWIAQENGLAEGLVNGVCSAVAWLGSAGSTSRVAQTGKIAALSTLYIAMTYAFSGAGSAAGVEAGNEEGRDNNHPRSQVQNLQGLPLRLYSAHSNLMEMFGGFGLTAALTAAIAPADQSLINLLGLHVISKCFIYYPAYLFNVGPARTVAHVLATASVINVALKLSKRPIL
ncbi:hypothetical protein LTR86_009492 [Recurvomyces mirabilis]|nr:hypothetical protein LTR86_009492 [Recurvomyces mirabilis]